MIDYKLYYGLEFDPFEKGQKDIVINTGDYQEAMARLNFLKGTRGIGLLTGRPGVGKTFVIKQFCESLNPGLYKTVYIPLSSLTTVEFYRHLSENLGLSSYGKKSDNYRSIQDYIKRTVDEKRIVPVIVLDEAQYLKTEVLNDLIMLLNFNFDSVNYVILILVGIPVLSKTLLKPIHEALNQRIVIRYMMDGAGRKDVESYVIRKLEGAGKREPMFTANAFEALSSVSQGSSRKLNTLCTHAMIIGASRKKEMIDENIIMEAANELE